MKFIVDGMLGKLGRWLRFMGYDTLYFNTHKKVILIRKAKEEGRIILTKDRKLSSENPEIVIFLCGENTREQLAEVKKKLLLSPDPEKFFTICSLCNVKLEEKKKEEVKGLVPEYVYKTQNEFSQCPRCKRVYWKGTHWEKMNKVLSEL